MTANTRGQKSIVSVKELEDARQVLSEANARESFDGLANILSRHGITVNRSTVFRWLNPIGELRESTKQKVVRAARALASSREAPMKLRVGVKSYAAEHLPLHLLRILSDDRDKTYEATDSASDDKNAMSDSHSQVSPEPHWTILPSSVTHSGVEIQVQPFNSITDALDALQNGHIEAAAAPRDFIAKNELPNVARLFKISEVDAWALLPIYEFSSPREITAYLQNVVEQRDMYIAVLANGDYLKSIRDYIKEDFNAFQEVSDSGEAFKLLKNEKVVGCIGNRLIVENILERVQVAIDDKTEPLPGLLNKLKIMRPYRFGLVKTDIYVRTDINPQLAAAIFQLICKTMDIIMTKRNTPKVLDAVDQLLGLKQVIDGKIISAPMTAKLFFAKHSNHFRYKIATFETSTLEKFWK